MVTIDITEYRKLIRNEAMATAALFQAHAALRALSGEVGMAQEEYAAVAILAWACNTITSGQIDHSALVEEAADMAYQAYAADVEVYVSKADLKKEIEALVKMIDAPDIEIFVTTSKMLEYLKTWREQIIEAVSEKPAETAKPPEPEPAPETDDPAAPRLPENPVRPDTVGYARARYLYRMLKAANFPTVSQANIRQSIVAHPGPFEGLSVTGASLTTEISRTLNGYPLVFDRPHGGNGNWEVINSSVPIEWSEAKS